MAKKRVYKKGAAGSEYAYGATEEQKNNRVARNRARREAIRDGKVSKGTAENKSTQEIDHKVPLSKGGSKTDKSNTRVVSRSVNRKKYNSSTCAKKPSKKK
jgi:hypothetical protein